MQLDIIIVNYNTGSYLRDCLESIYRNSDSRYRYRIVIYDNASSDSSLQYAKAAFPHVNYIGNHSNVGFARAVNTAVKQTDSQFILLLNPDVLILPGVIKLMTGFMVKHPRCGILGGEILSPLGYRQPTCRHFPNYYNILFGRRSLARRIFPNNPFTKKYLYLDLNSGVPHKVDFVEGSLMMLRRKALNEVGLFDEAYFLYVEDADLCYRMQKHGWETWWLPQSYAIHYRGESFRKDNIHPAMHHSKGFYEFFKKHSSPSFMTRHLMKLLLAFRLLYVISSESIKKVLHDINFSPRR